MALRRLLLSNSGSRSSKITKAFRVFSYSTEALLTTSKDPASTPKDNLVSRIFTLHGVPVSPVLDQWVDEGRAIKHSDVYGTITQLRFGKRFNQALEVSEWMSKHLELLPRDIAVRLKLICMVRGLKEAEEYFDSLPSNLRAMEVYGSLLNCYVRANSMEKAEATMQKMKELGYFTTKPPYYCMLKYYYETREFEKLEALAQEMEENGFVGDIQTLSYQLKAYGDKSDIQGLEKILAKIRADPVMSVDWNVYVEASSRYLRAGLNDKALEMLKTSEQFIEGKSKKSAYQVLLRLYANLENKDGVYRIWGLCNKTGALYTKNCIFVLEALFKLDDLVGMEKIYEEWEAKSKVFDVQVPNLLIRAYCKRSLMENAESVVNRLVESVNKPTASTWGHMAFWYCKYSQLDKAVEAMKKAILVSHPKWKPDYRTLVACTEYMKEKGDEEFAEFSRVLDKYSHLVKDISDTVEEHDKENKLPSE